MSEILKVIKEELKSYSVLSESEKDSIASRNWKSWFLVADKMDELCSENEEYISIEEKIHDINSRLSFDFKHAFTHEIIQTRGYEDVWDEVPEKWRKDSYEYHIDIATNAREYNEELKKEIERIKNAKIVINRIKKVKDLEEQIVYNEKFKKIYDNLIELERRKEQCLRGEASTLKDLKARRNEILFGYAKKVVYEALKENPTLICNEKEVNSVIGKLNGNETYMLFKVFNDIRKEAIEELTLERSVNKR